MSPSQRLNVGPAAGLRNKLGDLPNKVAWLPTWLSPSSVGTPCQAAHLLFTTRVPSMPCLLPAFISRHLVLGWPPSNTYSWVPHPFQNTSPYPVSLPLPILPFLLPHPYPSLVQSRYLLNKGRVLYSHIPTFCWHSQAMVPEHQGEAWEWRGADVG